jgi:hypothetical protein
VRLVAAVAVLLALGCGTAAAAKVDPVALLMQQSIKKALQADLKKQVPGLKVTTVKCKVNKTATKGTCRANWKYKTVFGYYSLAVKQPKVGRPSYASTKVRCFNAKTKKAVPCN